MKKKILATLAALLFIGVGCMSSPNKPEREDFVGSWQLSENQSIILDEDGRFFSHLNERPSFEGVWSYTEGLFVLDSETNDAFDASYSNISLEEDTLYLVDKEGVNISWKRIRSE